MSDTAPDYKNLLTSIIKNQIVIFGPAITLAKVRHVPGIQVAEDGTVINISDKPEVINRQLIDQFLELSLPITRKTMLPLMSPQPNASPPQDDDQHQAINNHTQQLNSHLKAEENDMQPAKTNL